MAVVKHFIISQTVLPHIALPSGKGNEHQLLSWLLGKGKMTVREIYFDGTDVARRPLDSEVDTEYSITDGLMRIFQNGRIITKQQLRTGSLYCIDQIGRLRHALRVVLPSDNASAFMWLLDFPKETRSRYQDTFRQRLQKAVASNRDHQLTCFSGPGYSFALCAPTEDPRENRVTAYIDREVKVNAAFVKDVLLGWQWGIYYPQAYTEQVLRHRFGLSDADLSELSARPGFYRS